MMLIGQLDRQANAKLEAELRDYDTQMQVDAD